jgi:hypothetical protein
MAFRNGGAYATMFSFEKEIILEADVLPGQAGLFLLTLKSHSALRGAPVVTLRLTVDMPHRLVRGLAEVTQPLANAVVCLASVNGTLTPEYVMPPGKSAMRLDLDGYPDIHWPPNSGLGPQLPLIFKAVVVLDTSFEMGFVDYQYRQWFGDWHRIPHQEIAKAG